MSKLLVLSRFGVTPVQVLNNSSLSFKAKGLYGFIQSKPDGWQFSAERIAKQSNDGVTSVRSGLQELVDAGLLVRKCHKDEKGKWEWEYILLENPSAENPPTDNALAENLPNTSKKDIVKKNSNIEVDTSEQSSREIVQVIDAFIEWNKAAKTWYSNKTQRAAIHRLIEEYGTEMVCRVVTHLPQSNTKEFFPTITTPAQLEQKWSQLETTYQRYKQDLIKKSERSQIATI